MDKWGPQSAISPALYCSNVAGASTGEQISTGKRAPNALIPIHLINQEMAEVTRLSGTQFRGWLLTHELGRGDSAIVYAARQGDNEAAIKIFFPDILGKHGVSEEKDRLELQLQLRGKKHPHLVEIHDGGVADELDGTLFLIMENVPGHGLDKVVDKIPPSSIGPLIRQLADAARFLEEQGLVHRDIKPANIIVNEAFSRLTLLDLGIIKPIAPDESGRLSGQRFVATARYSPPEFVWRAEGESIEASRAITFYQLGGVLHDLIMKKCLFDGQDQPPARLYDSIKLVSPDIQSEECEQWLVILAKCCLVKNWRERMGLVPSWENFSAPDIERPDISQKRTNIRLRQVRREEVEIAKQANQSKAPGDQRVRELWDLQDKVFLECRRFLTGTGIFPRFSAQHCSKEATTYLIRFEFDRVPQLGFDRKVKVEISLSIKQELGESTELKFSASSENGDVLYEGQWVELLTVDSAAQILQQALVQVADKVVPAA